MYSYCSQLVGINEGHLLQIVGIHEQRKRIQAMAGQRPGEPSPVFLPLFATAGRPILGGNPAEPTRTSSPLHRGESSQALASSDPGNPPRSVSLSLLPLSGRF